MKTKKLLYILVMGLSVCSLLSGCVFTRKLHMEAEASFDDAKQNFKGPSPIKPLGDAGTNYMYELFESVNEFVNPPLLGSEVGPNSTPFGSTGLSALAYGRRPMYGRARAYSVVADASGTSGQKGYVTFSEGLEFIKKGYKTKGGGATDKTNLYYLEIPVLANYNYPVKGGVVHAGLGPYAAAALGGNDKIKYQGQTIKSKLSIGNSATDDYKRMDYGLQFKVGYHFLKKWDVSLNYDLGLRQANNDAYDKFWNRSFGVNVGYQFK